MAVIKWAPPLITLAAAVALVVTSVYAPDILSDKGNGFLAGFVNHELLAFLGVVVTITLASAANLHLELNKLEDQVGRQFPKTRRSIRLSAYSLIALLFVGFVIVLIKPFMNHNEILSSLLNSAAVIIIIFDIFILIDLTTAILSIPSTSKLEQRKKHEKNNNK